MVLTGLTGAPEWSDRSDAVVDPAEVDRSDRSSRSPSVIRLFRRFLFVKKGFLVG